MRFHDRGTMPYPEYLHSSEVSRVKEEIDYFLSQVASKGEQRRPPDHHRLLQNESLLESVVTAFGSACAYCESPAENVETGEIHHHRPPLLAADQSGKTDLVSYVWLIPEWENLYWVCGSCARNKANKFYVEKRRGQPGSPIKLLREKEGALLLDPCFDSPSEHLHFLADGSVQPRSEKGALSIEVLDLNSEDLVMVRRAANNDLAYALEDNPEEVTCFKTGAKSTLDAEILMPQPEKPEQSFKPMGHSTNYPGASTLALLEWYGSQTTLPPSARGFKSSFLDLTKSGQGELMQAFRDQISGDQRSMRSEQESYQPDTSSQETQKPAKLSTPSRTLNRKLMPLAESLIQTVSIRNFKALREIEFTIPQKIDDPRQVPCMLILGENATGKSSVLEALTLSLLGTAETAQLDKLLDDEDVRPSEMIHRPDPTDWDVISEEELSVKLTFYDQDLTTNLTGGGQDKRFAGDPESAKIMLGYGPRRFFTKKLRRRFRAPAYRVKSLFDPMATITNPTPWLTSCNKKNFNAAARALREILLLDEDQDFTRRDDQIIIDTEGGRTPLSEMSVGYKSVVAMATDIIRELMYHYDNLELAHAVVLIDEIETHLHPRWKMRIMGLLRRAFPKVQFIVTTHDPLCLRGMFDGEVFVLQRSAEDQRVETLVDLPRIQGMRAEQILTSEFFGLGSTDPETEAQLAVYNSLAARIETLEVDEKAQLEKLRCELDHNMVLGNTMAEQAYSEALKKEVADTQVTPTKVRNPNRKRMVVNFAEALRKGRGK